MSTLYDRRAAARIRPANDNGLPAGLARPPFLIRLALTLAEWRRRYRTRQSLASLSAFQLRDIGLTLADAQRECDKPFWRE